MGFLTLGNFLKSFIGRILLLNLFVLLAVQGPALASVTGLQQMVGQMIMIGFQGNNINSAGFVAARNDIEAGRIGGVMYLRFNVSSLGNVEKMNAAFIAANNSLAPFIALDQEGGRVERLTKDVGFGEIASAATIAATQNLHQAQDTYFAMASDLSDLRFNLNLGPVVDLNINPNNPIIAKFQRSYGIDSNVVTSYATSFIDAHRQAGILSALKHFPGHGSSRADTHEGFVDISAYWQPEELAPYRNLIRAGKVDMVMMAHLFHERFSNADGAQLPASLSKSWIDGVLRNELGYNGVVISDDMEMGAITARFSMAEAIILAVEAGSDILLFSNTANYRPGLAKEIGDILIAKAQADPAFMARIEQSYGRIIRLKQNL